MTMAAAPTAAADDAPPQSPAATEYRILALYRFVPLVVPSDADRGGAHSVDAAPSSGGGEAADEAAGQAPQQTPTWDAASLMAHPERHPTLRQLQSELLATLRKYDAKGTLLIAPEGINGTICYPFPPPPVGGALGGANDDEDPVIAYLTGHPLFGGPELRTRRSVWTEQENGQQAFHRLKIKIKAEIVTLGLGRPLVDRKPIVPTAAEEEAAKERHKSNRLADPRATKGRYLTPVEWDEACRDPEVMVIDTRNRYEVEIGTFENAVDPQTQNFSEFPEYLERLSKEYDWNNIDASGGSGERMADGCEGNKKPPPKGIAMFCTGGIRCEKATSFAMQSGLFPKELPIYQLEGGILAYLDDVAKRNDEKETTQPQSAVPLESTFKGECFVFDKRVALTEGLKPSEHYTSCHGCRGPMDRRLLRPPTDGPDGNGSNISNEEIQRHEELARGIPNLPPLRYDVETKQHYLPGLTCPRCHATTTRESLERFAQRERQVEVCAKEGRPLFRDDADRR